MGRRLHDLWSALPAEIQAGEVAAAIVALGEISGENATEDLLDTIFSRSVSGSELLSAI
jgi:tRNA U34 5-carboxymethylaminomethyl modifying GTPase MnmE/TrmE